MKGMSRVAAYFASLRSALVTRRQIEAPKLVSVALPLAVILFAITVICVLIAPDGGGQSLAFVRGLLVMARSANARHVCRAV